MDVWPLYKVSGMSRDNVVRTRYFHYVYDLSSCLHVKIAARVGRVAGVLYDDLRRLQPEPHPKSLQ